MENANENALVKLESLGEEIFEAGGIDATLKQIETYYLAEVHDPTTKKGLARIRSAAAEVTTTKTTIEKMRKSLSDKLNAQIKPILGEGNKAKDFLTKLSVKIREPLTKIEDAEKKRKADIEAILKGFLFLDILAHTIDTLKEHIQKLESVKITDDDFQEYTPRAIMERDDEIARCKGLIVIKEEKEERAKKQKAEHEERMRVRIQAEEKAKAEAEAQAKVKKMEAELKAKLEAEAKEKEEAFKAEARRLLSEKEAANAIEREKERQAFVKEADSEKPNVAIVGLGDPSTEPIKVEHIEKPPVIELLEIADKGITVEDVEDAVEQIQATQEKLKDVIADVLTNPCCEMNEHEFNYLRDDLAFVVTKFFEENQ